MGRLGFCLGSPLPRFGGEEGGLTLTFGLEDLGLLLTLRFQDLGLAHPFGFQHLGPFLALGLHLGVHRFYQCQRRGAHL